jgi:hypothetical protein
VVVFAAYQNRRSFRETGDSNASELEPRTFSGLAGDVLADVLNEKRASQGQGDLETSQPFSE